MTLIDRYIRTAAWRAFVLVAAMLTTLFSLLEFVEQLSSVGQGSYSVVDALVYTVLTAPFRLVQVTPVSMLLGSLLALGALAGTSELMALHSLGVSEIRVIGSVLRLVVPITLALFLMAEFVIPPAQQFAQERRTAALATSPSSPESAGFWAESERQYLNVREFESGRIPKDISIYSFAADGSLSSYIHADRAEAGSNGIWRLTDVSRKRIAAAQFQTERLASLAWPSFITPEQMRMLALPLDRIPPTALYRYVRDLKQRHEQALRYEQELWSRASIPFALIALAMITAPFVFRPPRQQTSGQQITVGAVFGIVFPLGQQIIRHLTLLLGVNPAIGTFAPPVVLMLVAVYLFRQTNR